MTDQPSQMTALSGTRNQIIFWLCVFAFLIFIAWLFNAILLPFVLGTIIAYLLDPAVKAMRRRNIPRWMASLLILGTFGLFIIGLLLALLPLAYRETVQLIHMAPTYIDQAWAALRPYSQWLQELLPSADINNLQGAIQQNVSTMIKTGGGLFTSLASGGSAIINFLYLAVLTPIIAFFIMNEWPTMKRWMDSMLPRHGHETIQELWSEIDRKLSGFIRGQLIVAFILGMGYAVALTIAGLKFGFLIGIMTGLLSIIPFVGSTIGLVTSLGVAYVQSGGEWSYVVIIAAIFFTGQFLEGNFITPRLLGDAVGLHPLWIMFALMAGGSLLGLVGMLIAVPMAAAVGVMLGFLIRKYKASPFYRVEEETQPQSSSIILDPPA